jgi:translation initiation factor IF-1
LATQVLPQFKDTILELLLNAPFGVKLENEHERIAPAPGRMRSYRIGALTCDKVLVEITPDDLTEGGIT